MRALSKESLFRSWLFGAFLSALGAFPVRRDGANREAILTAVKILQAGEQIVVFPEGTRETGPKVVSVLDGRATSRRAPERPSCPSALPVLRPR